MKYIKVKIYTSQQGIEPLTAMLMEKGITGAVVENPADIEDLLSKKKEYEWDYIDKSVLENQDQEPVVSVYFEDTEEGREKVQELKIAVMMLKSKEMEGVFGWDVNLGRLYAEDILVDDEDWKDKWKEYFKPAKVTEKLVVKPTWEDYEAAEGDLVIEIDPGMAFGTGTHETTTLCLGMIEKYLKENQSVLDIGCGSGILSIAAAKLGSRQVLGIEIDPDAARTAEENVKANNVDAQVTVKIGDLTKDVDQKADLLAANLIAPLVIELSDAAAEHLNDGGVFISSGILTEKKDAVEEAVKKAGFDILETQIKGEWCAIAARKA
ncbi:50S ribosomal protein L11 methyltransferase [Anaerovorax odorimutans]|uniref:Ribosomal protein L11 methyltransferase n=1 Tax=Anaerovorax odorimutans TaxID=109327 RepID=A0ABT1RLH9_9FIRM|nr:50S ribosomal protein L11 methyltransferase [Anaerovorax odorimutans]MCQ4636048.1 50S ribosomal protein L11 methyltransferase [Anaerovorax odorimutans]